MCRLANTLGVNFFVRAMDLMAATVGNSSVECEGPERVAL